MAKQPGPEALFFFPLQCVIQAGYLILHPFPFLIELAVFGFPGCFVLEHQGDSLLQCGELLLDGIQLRVFCYFTAIFMVSLPVSFGCLIYMDFTISPDQLACLKFSPVILASSVADKAFSHIPVQLGTRFSGQF